MFSGVEYEIYKKEKFNGYKKRLEELRNTRIIYQQKSSGPQHGFDDPQYQRTLKELIDGIYRKG